MNPIRVLHVLASLDRGGAETMLMTIYRNIDRSKVQFDFVVNEQTDKYAFESEIKKLGGRVFRIPSYKVTNHLSYKRTWRKLIRNHPEWKIVHAHHTVPAFIYLRIAKKMNRITIAHSHTAGGEKTLKSKIRILMRYPLRYISRYYLACSKAAAEWMFGKKSTETYILNNAIDTKTFNFNNGQRKIKRRELKVEDKFVVGHVGRFDPAKNHTYLIDIFKSIHDKNKESILILVGDGKLKKSIEKKVIDLGLTDSVIFTGVRADIAELLQAMDVFVFPSVYEGLGVAVIEAQAAGLPCVISDTITEEVKISNELLEFVSLNRPSQEWAEKIMRFENINRRNTYSEVVNAGYDINNSASWIQSFYLDSLSE